MGAAADLTSPHSNSDNSPAEFASLCQAVYEGPTRLLGEKEIIVVSRNSTLVDTEIARQHLERCRGFVHAVSCNASAPRKPADPQARSMKSMHLFPPLHRSSTRAVGGLGRRTGSGGHGACSSSRIPSAPYLPFKLLGFSLCSVLANVAWLWLGGRVSVAVREVATGFVSSLVHMLL